MRTFQQFIEIEDKEAALGFLDVLCDCGFDYIESAECFGCELDDSEEAEELEVAQFTNLEVMVGKWFLHFEDDFCWTGETKIRQVIQLPEDGIQSARYLASEFARLNKKLDAFGDDIGKIEALLRSPDRQWGDYEKLDQGRDVLNQVRDIHKKKDILCGDKNPYMDYSNLADV